MDIEYEKIKPYNYSKLFEIVPTISKSFYYNFYAFIIDSSAPYLKLGLDKYVSNIKVADCEDVDNNGQNKIYQVTIISKFYFSIPNNIEAGTIIRVHRATMIQKENSRSYLTCDQQFKGSWCLFEANPTSIIHKYDPILSSGKSYTFTKGDIPNIDRIRESSFKYFEKNEIFSNSISLKDSEQQKNDIDTLVFVLLKRKSKINSNYYQLKIMDNTKIAILDVSYSNKAVIETGDCLRIRSCNYKLNSTSKLYLRDYSTIIKIPPFAMIYTKLYNKIFELKSINNILYYNAMIYIKFLNESKLTKIEELSYKTFESLNSLKEGDIVKLSVVPIKTNPKGIKEWIKSGDITLQNDQPDKQNSISNAKVSYEFIIQCLDNQTSELISLKVDPEISLGFIPFNFCENKKVFKEKLKIIKRILIYTNCTIDVAVKRKGNEFIICNTRINLEL